MPAAADPTGARGPDSVVPGRPRRGARGSEAGFRLHRPAGREGSVGASHDPSRAGVRIGARGGRTPPARKRLTPAARGGREGVKAWEPGNERGGIKRGGRGRGGIERGGSGRKGTERKGTERKGTEREGTERKGTEREGTERVAPAPGAEGRARACGCRSPCDRAPSSHRKRGGPMGRGAGRPGAAAPLPFDASPGSLKIEGPRVPLPSHRLGWTAPSRHTLETGHVEEGRGT